ncbi:3-phosphoserine/phosphohydroxythreonine transaminase [Desulforhopalus vacuolatus]|uniref:3-phosphoserine/phosphohydroxythreonine transaminase n=1 Tax=Desulforhopalus vacuolatus TaxID=40414 RepID=UPI00196253A2|nr:3-phosphoserine/phosphohydroxythreonine transaminase [Desulforhopalus vacuolatus]MBM9519625.1 3-phosphoserine/phosphohydroxythreonine transaminase [Desulforhopalus vacuolatus]
MKERTFNFSAGPSTLPVEALEKARDALFDFAGTGIGIMEISHRSQEFSAYILEVEANLRTLLGIADNYKVLFLQGGGSSQFFMVPMNLLLDKGKKATYLNTGVWSKKAIAEARLFGEVAVGFDGSAEGFHRVPRPDEFTVSEGSEYLYYTSNNTIYGSEYSYIPQTETMLVCDMSSDFLSRPVDVNRYGLIFAGAQKNLGPAGVTIVIIREDLLERAPLSVPTMLRYKTHADKGSMFNTPPVVNIFVAGEVLKLLKKSGGLEAVQQRNMEKAALLYEVLDSGDYYRGYAERESRSLMNVSFNLATPELESKFVAEALAAGMSGLKGHRDAGGCRASIYNAFPKEGVERLAQFMTDFAQKNPA